MPELPEVETTRRGLAPHLLGRAIHGVILVGSMIVLGTGHGAVQLTLGFIAVVLATVNAVGGFVVTDRMLEMFKGRDRRR